jgi:hypothetical protein
MLMTRLLFTILAPAVFLSCLPGVGVGATFTVNSSSDVHDPRPGDGICGDSDGGFCTFRAAVEEAAALQGSDTVRFEQGLTPVRLTLGTVIVEGNNTVITGNAVSTIIDGLGNPFAAASIEIDSDSNNISALIIERSRGHGLVINGAFNLIGGADTTERNHFIQCGLDYSDAFGIYIAGSRATDNMVIGNFVGTTVNGGESSGGANGVGIDDLAHDNRIGGMSPAEGNLISGNVGYGISILGGAHDNLIAGNIIGGDPSGTVAVGNRLGGIAITGGAHDNSVGSSADLSGNLISGNGAVGLLMSGDGTTRNSARNNSIGSDFSGRLMLSNSGPGVLISDGADSNRVGGCLPYAGNLISGNQGDGVRITGVATDGNIISGNFIGLEIRGYSDLSNGLVEGNGVSICDGARDNVIGGVATERNVISGNYRFGVYLTDAGTAHNRVVGNYIGTTYDGGNVLSNGSGVVIRHGSSENVIGGSSIGEGNVISGNRDLAFPFGAGVIIYDMGSDGNRVQGNMIGADVTGTRSIRNGTSGIVIGAGAQHNIIGGSGPGEGNLISGNGVGSLSVSLGRGVHIFGDGTRYNRVAGNIIGADISGTVALPNNGVGVAVVGGASDTQIGGDTASAGNLIAWNHAFGVLISDSTTKTIRIRYNRMFSNDSLGIDIRGHAQDGIVPPVLEAASPTEVTGRAAVVGGMVDLYLAVPDISGYGEGSQWLASAIIGTDSSFTLAPEGVSPGDTLTAIVTDPRGNSSSFARNIVVDEGTEVRAQDSLLPNEFGLCQNYPNPCNPSTEIIYSLPRAMQVSLSIYNLLGQEVVTLVRGSQPMGTHRISWDGCDSQGASVSSGVYIYRLNGAESQLSRKLLLLR